jgi:hypothetical protein
MNALHIVVAMKPVEENYTENALSRGVTGLAIDAARVGDKEMKVTKSDGTFLSDNKAMGGHNTGRIDAGTKTGRWPSNIMHDGSEDIVDQFPETHSPGTSGGGTHFVDGVARDNPQRESYTDTGSAARYFKEILDD